MWFGAKNFRESQCAANTERKEVFFSLLLGGAPQRLYSAPTGKDIESCQFATFLFGSGPKGKRQKGFLRPPWGVVCLHRSSLRCGARRSSKGVALVSPSIRRSCFNWKSIHHTRALALNITPCRCTRDTERSKWKYCNLQKVWSS